MAINYPASLDSLGSAANREIIQPNHINDLRRAAEELQGQTGVTDSSVETSLRYLAKHVRPTTISGNLRIVHQHSEYTTIAEALAASSSGDTVLVMPGTYSLTTGLTIPSGVNLQGFSKNSVTITDAVNVTLLVTVEGNNIISDSTLSTSLSSGVIYDGGNDIDNIEIRNCSLSCPTGFDTIKCSSSTTGKWVIDSCDFTDFYYDGIATRADPLIVRNCYVNASPTVPTASAAFINFQYGKVFLSNNHVILSRSDAGLDAIAFVESRTASTDPEAKLCYSSGNIVEISAVDDNCYGFSATSGCEWMKFYSSGDLFSFSTTGTAAAVSDQSTLGTNYFEMCGGNGYTINSAGNGSEIKTPIGYGFKSFRFDGVDYSENRNIGDSSDILTAILGALTDLGIFHNSPSVDFANYGPNLRTWPFNGSTESYALWVALGVEGISIRFDGPPAGTLTTSILKVVGSVSGEIAATAVSGNGKGTYLFTWVPSAVGNPQTYTISFDSNGITEPILPGDWTFTMNV